MLLLCTAHCGELDECKNLPPSFQLDMQLEDPSLGPQVAFVALTVRADAARFRRRFPANDTFEDGVSSIAVTISPPPSQDFELAVQAVALDVGTSTLAVGIVTTDAENNGCNQLEIQLQ
ncbi:MAG: hypothetical protein AAFN74_22725 [Myxococcota bacterium]